MAEELRGYDGAVNGIQIHNGIAIASPSAPTGAADAFQARQEIEIRPVVQRAIDVIGDPEEALRWLGTPVRALGYATPISRLHDPGGCEQVLLILSQLEHGVL
jgi:hypothetical protein